MEFRSVTQEVQEQIPEKSTEVTGIVENPEEVPKDIKPSSLEDWEVMNGKYGLEYLGIKNIADTFPIKMHFGALDKYIKEEISERGIDATPETWQNILKELEAEIGTEKNAYKRLQRLNDYIKVIRKIKSLKELKNSYTKI